MGTPFVCLVFILVALAKKRSFSMPRRIYGILLLIVSALLYATRYLTAAIFGSGMMGWSTERRST